MTEKQIIIKSIIGFLQLLLFMGLMVFLPAWTLNYWQGWAFLASFFIPVIFITIYFIKNDPKLIERRLKAGPGAETLKSQKIIQAFASIAFLGVMIISALDHRFRWMNVPCIISMISCFGIIAGFYIIFLVFRENSYTSATIEVGEEQKVITTGPYAVVRHPMYSGALVMFLFIPPALDSLAGLICTVMLLVVLILRSLNEEKYLADHLEGYKAYCSKVTYRLIPFIW